MAINPHDDYEALAKLLYPSIEASGNVYYGQTRKLAIDELFDKNESGFESYFCSLKNEDNSLQYKEHFHWKLGPFSDTVKVVTDDTSDDKTYKDYPLAWLKYSLAKKETEHTNGLNAGEYKTYEVEYILGQPSLYCSLDGLLPDGDIYDGRSFFLDGDSDNKVLYVLLYKAPVYEDMDKPLYIEALTDDIQIKLNSRAFDGEWSETQFEQCVYKCGYNYSSQDEDLPLDKSIDLKRGCRIYFRCEDRPIFSSDKKFVQFRITSTNENAEVAVGGNIESMAKFENGSMIRYTYYKLFSENHLITDASKLYIGKLSNYYSCSNLFSACGRLKIAPAILPCLKLEKFCYHNMFSLCSDLEKPPILPAGDGAINCYMLMFQSPPPIISNKLHYITCLLKLYKDEYAAGLLSGRTDVTSITVLANSGWESATNITIPDGCRIEVLESTIYTSSTDISVSNTPIEKYLVTHGTNNENNGRGDITNPATLANMEKSFDENNNHPMNTYNVDGSFNQEIWGYKSFCSPVQFRNGIYTDTLSVLSTYESGVDSGYNYDLTSSVIKNAGNDDLDIRLTSGTYKHATSGLGMTHSSYGTVLRGYSTQEKSAVCHTYMQSIDYYNVGTEDYTCNSTVEALCTGGTATSEISVRSGNTHATIRAELYNKNKSEIDLLVNVDGDSFKSLNISKEGSKFTGDVFADNITVKTMLASQSIETNYIIAHQGIEAESISTNGSIFSSGDIFALNGKEFIGNLSGEVAKVDKIYTSEIDASQSSSGINVKSDVTFEKPIYLNGITSQGDIEIDNGKKFIGDLDGVIPYVERDSFHGTVPVGCIVFLKIEDLTANKIWSTYNPYEVGTEFTSNNDGTDTKIFSIGGFGESGMLEDSSPLSGRQTFRTLSRCEFSENGVAYVLAIRVA